MVQLIKFPQKLPPVEELRIIHLGQLLTTHKLIGRGMSQLIHQIAHTEQNDDHLAKITGPYEKRRMQGQIHSQLAKRKTNSTQSQHISDKLTIQSTKGLTLEPITTKLIARERVINKPNFDQLYETELKPERLPALKISRKKPIVHTPKVIKEDPSIIHEIHTMGTLEHQTQAISDKHSGSKKLFMVKTQQLLTNESEAYSIATTSNNARFNINKKGKKRGVSDIMLKLLERTKIDGKVVIGKPTLNKVDEYPSHSVSPHPTSLKIVTEEPRVAVEQSRPIQSNRGEVVRSIRQRIQIRQRSDGRVDMDSNKQKMLVEMVRKREEFKRKRDSSPQAQEIQEDIQGEQRADWPFKLQSQPNSGERRQKPGEWSDQNEFLHIGPIKEELCEQSSKLDVEQPNRVQRKRGQRLGRSMTNVKVIGRSTRH